MPRRTITHLVLVVVLGASFPVLASPVSAQVEEFTSYSARAELTGDHADVFRLYWAFFDREPDVAGAKYWAGQFDRCASLLDITWSFGNSAEFQGRYGNLGNEQYVELVYANVLGRRPDDEGRRYWLDLLDRGELLQSELMLYFSLGQEFRNRRPLPSDGRPPAGCRQPGESVPVIAAGTYRVGTEVPAGVYRVVRYWATLDENQTILDNDLVGENGLSLAVVPAGATFIQFAGEATALRDQPVVDPVAEGRRDGTYLVGTDIQPGQYRVSRPGELAYAARLDARLDIIDNDLNTGSVILTIQPSDYAFTFSGQLERIG